MADERTILVTGATGNQGGAAARRLLEAGWRVRALTRQPSKPAAQALAERGAELVAGDLDDVQSLGRALDGVDGVFSVQNFWEHGAEAEIRQGKALGDAAAQAGVAHVVYSSVGSADRGTGISHFDSKREIELHLLGLGVPLTILRPVFLLENFDAPHYKPMILGGTLALPIPSDRLIQVIASEDVGALAALVFSQPDRFVGEAVEIGTAELTGPQMAEVFSRVLGREVRFVQAPIERLRAMNPEVAEMWEWFGTDGYRADIEAVRALHPGALSLEDWLRRGGWDKMEAPVGPPGGGPPPGVAGGGGPPPW